MLIAPTIDEIEAAARRIEEHVLRLPLVRLKHAPAGREIWLKCENQQPHGSFKIRPAVNAILSRDPADLEHGIYTASAGNFALGVAAAAQSLGHAITVYVPDNAARKKLDALTELGATIKPLPFNAWWQVMMDHGHPDEPGLFLHPVADPAVLAGDATIGLEIMEDLPDADAILVPFGGGGLISGISAAAKSIRQQVRAIGCESTAATPLAAALTANCPVEVPFNQSTFINGIGSTRVLDEMWPLLRDLVDGTIAVEPADAEEALRTLNDQTGQIAEGAGAVPLAAALSDRVQTGKIVCVISGGNIDRKIAAEILDRP